MVTPEMKQAMQDLVEDMIELNREIPQSELDEIARLGREHPLPRDRALRLYTRIARLLAEHGSGLDGLTPEQYAERLVGER
jgi:hypothetical protein